MSDICEGVGQRPNEGDIVDTGLAKMRSGGYNNGTAVCPSCGRLAKMSQNGAIMRHKPNDPKRHTRESYEAAVAENHRQAEEWKRNNMSEQQFKT